MLESICSLIKKLLYSSSIDEQIGILVDTPNLDAATFLAVCHDSQKYGFSKNESDFLSSHLDQYSKIILALSGELRPVIPSILYGKIGMIYRLRGNVEKAKTYYLYAFNTAATDEEKAMALSSYGTLEMQQQKINSAETTLKRALKICEDNGITNTTFITIINNLGLLAMDKQNYEKGIEYFEKASGCAKQANSFRLYMMARFNLVEVYRRNRQYRQGHQILDEVEMYVSGRGSWAEDTLYTLRNRLLEEEDASSAIQHRGQQLDVVLNLIKRACEDAYALQELKQTLLALPFPIEEITDRVRELLPELYRQNSKGCYRMALLLREVVVTRESAVALAEITCDLCLCFKYSTSEERIQWLEEAFAMLKLGNPVVLSAAKAMLSDVAANEYIHRNSPNRKDDLFNAIHYLKETLRFLEGKEFHAKPLLEALNEESAKIKTQKAHIHYNIATSYNALFSIEREPNLNKLAVEHFKTALAYLPELPETDELRIRIQINLGNALAFSANYNLPLAMNGKVDKAVLLESLQTQSDTLEKLQHNSPDYFNALIDITQTYIDLAKASQYADRSDYFDAASQCLAAAKHTIQDLPGIKADYQVPWLIAEAQLALNYDSGGDNLRRVGSLLDQTLPLIDKTSLHEKAVTLYTHGCNIWDRLGDKPRAYSYLLKGLHFLYDLLFSGHLLLQGAATGILQAYFSHLISQLLKWGETERALFFLNQCISIGWHHTSPGGEKNKLLLPRRIRRVTRKGQTVIQFWLLFKAAGSMNEFVAFIITPDGVQYHRYDFDLRELLRIWFEWSEANFRYKSALETDTSDPSYLVRVQNRLSELKDILTSIVKKLGKLLFFPIESLLPVGGELVIVPDSVLRELPLHLATLEKQGEVRYLTDLYDVVYCEYVDTESRMLAPEERKVPAMISFLSYYPPGAPLPFSHFESAAVADTIDPAYLNVKLDQEATVESLVKGLRTADILHLCCHGNYFRSNPLDSSFLLADNLISLQELQLRLYNSSCSLIVLSACESGMRGFRGSYEDVGFPGILLNTGCQMVIGALWRIKDISTAMLMGEFYNGLTQTAGSPHFALCHAQRWLSTQTSHTLISNANKLLIKYKEMFDPIHRLEIESGLNTLLKGEEIRPFEHPFYWGAFYAVKEKVSLLRK